MHKKLNLFEYQITKDKKIELTTIQIANLISDIFKDYDFLKYELNHEISNKTYEDYEDYEDKEDLRRSYNKGNDIVELFDKYHNKKRTKKSVYEQIGEELNIKWKSVQKTYLENK